MCKVLTVWVEVGGLFLLANLYVSANLTTSSDSMKLRVAIGIDMHYFSKMVGSKRNLANCYFDSVGWARVT